MKVISDGQTLKVILIEEYHDPKFYRKMEKRGFIALRLTKKIVLWTELSECIVQGELFGGAL